MPLSLILAESALQRVPKEIQSHPQIKQYAGHRRKAPGEVLLDRAFHHAAMQRLARTKHPIPSWKMGRPDIVHNTLLQVLETPLNWEGGLEVYVHTQEDSVIWVNPQVRLPKNYIRFVGLIEQLYQDKRVPNKDKPLLRIEPFGLEHLFQKLAPDVRIGFSRIGKPELMRNVAELVKKAERPLVLIGGFPRGHFHEATDELVSHLYSVDKEPLDAWVVAGRFVYDFEWAIGLAQHRLRTQPTTR